MAATNRLWTDTGRRSLQFHLAAMVEDCLVDQETATLPQPRDHQAARDMAVVLPATTVDTAAAAKIAMERHLRLRQEDHDTAVAVTEA